MIKRNANDTFRTNVTFLMQVNHISFQDIDRMSGVGISTSYLRQIMKGESKSPTLDKVEAIAAIFKLTAWQLVQPTLPERIAGATDIDPLIDDYMASSEQGRENILMTARLARSANNG